MWEMREDEADLRNNEESNFVGLFIMPHGICNLSSLTRDQIQAPCIGSMES